VTLIRACAKASRSDVAEAMYWDLRQQKLEVTRSAGSALIVSLCAADATASAQTVYDDMMLVAAGDKSSTVRTTNPWFRSSSPKPCASLGMAAKAIWFGRIKIHWPTFPSMTPRRH